MAKVTGSKVITCPADSGCVERITKEVKRTVTTVKVKKCVVCEPPLPPAQPSAIPALGATPAVPQEQTEKNESPPYKRMFLTAGFGQIADPPTSTYGGLVGLLLLSGKTRSDGINVFGVAQLQTGIFGGTTSPNYHDIRATSGTLAGRVGIGVSDNTVTGREMAIYFATGPRVTVLSAQGAYSLAGIWSIGVGVVLSPVPNSPVRIHVEFNLDALVEQANWPNLSLQNAKFGPVLVTPVLGLAIPI